MAQNDEEPKHPYVTRRNAKVHLAFSMTVLILSAVQIIIGIVISEQAVSKIVIDLQRSDRNPYSYANYSTLFYGDHIWVGLVGIILGILGLSVWHTRARANGIMLSVMLFISGFLIYPIAAAMGGAIYEYEIRDVLIVREVSAVYTGLQAIFLIVWAFYTALHACCNSKVRKQTRFDIQQSGSTAPAGPPTNVVYVQQPIAYPGQYTGQNVHYTTAGQPVQYVTPTTHIGQTAPPGAIVHAQVPVEVVHGSEPGSTELPPSYSES